MALDQSRTQRRRGFLRIGAIVLAMTLAGCQSILPRSEPPPVTTAPPPPQQEQITGGIPQDGRHRVALLVPVSGGNSGVGQSIANAANMAILDTDTESVRITTYDTAGSGGAMAAANQALADGSQLFLGPLLAENVRTITGMVRNQGVPVISFSNDTGVTMGGVYVMGFTPAQSIARVVAYAKQNGSQRFAALVPSGLYGERAGQAFSEAVRDAGGVLIAVRSYDRDSRSLQRAVTQLNGEGNFDALLIADSGATARQAVRFLRSVKQDPVQIIGTELWNNQPDLSGYAELRGALFASVSDSTFQTLSRRYRERFGSAPYRLSSLGYDAALLVVRIAQNWGVDENFPLNQLVDAGGFTGVDGAFRFAGDDNVAERALEVQRIDSSGFTVISPAPGGFTE